VFKARALLKSKHDLDSNHVIDWKGCHLGGEYYYRFEFKEPYMGEV
jgi:hypothetical protein